MPDNMLKKGDRKVNAGKDAGILPIPGLQYLYSRSLSSFPTSVILVVGPTGSGKTLYCTEFVRNGLDLGDQCLYVNIGQTVSEQTIARNSHETAPNVTRRMPIVLTPSFSSNDPKATALQELSHKIRDILSPQERIQHVDERARMTRLVIDSLTQLIARFSPEQVQKFVVELHDLLKARGDVMALFTLTGNPSSYVVDFFGSLVDGVIQLRMEEVSGDDSLAASQQLSRGIRILSLKTLPVAPKWVAFQINDDSTIKFGSDVSATASAPVRCKLCHEPITGEGAGSESDSPYHQSCFITHKKLGEVYGLNVGYGLEPGVVNANFFFIDIVGLSDLSLSVEKQIKKIQELNSRIRSCEAFKAVTRTDKIVLPTGDGMAIGFLINPELPLQLSIQLHQELAEFNAKAPPDEKLGVRIGLGSGPVFVVSDINNNQNVWGPGIILARRVMDLGDSGHILLADNIAENLRNLKDEYKAVIRQVGAEHKIKHGQSLKLYSAYSREFGNPATPSKVAQFT